MATTCQPSYPLNSENASPPGTFTVYLSCEEMALPAETASTIATIAISETGILVIGRSCASVWMSNFCYLSANDCLSPISAQVSKGRSCREAPDVPPEYRLAAANLGVESTVAVTA